MLCTAGFRVGGLGEGIFASKPFDPLRNEIGKENNEHEGLELPTVTGAAWIAWEPLTTGDLLTVGLTAALGIPALTLAAVGLWQMRRASTERNRQLDAFEQSAADRHTETMTALNALIHGMEAVIERTAPGAGGETA